MRRHGFFLLLYSEKEAAGPMKVRRTYLPVASAALLLLSLSGTGRAQISAYASGTYGYQNNPLYNYEQTGDQVRSTYLELGYSSARLQAKYAGSLTLFNSLTERNFLDHSLLFALSFPPGPTPTAAATDSTMDEEPEDAPDEETPPDSLGTFGQIEAKLASRHDKSAFRDYDNAAAALQGFLRWGLESGWHLRLTPDVEYRVYPYTRELSSATAVLQTQFGFGGAKGLRGEVGALGGVKHFTTSAFDTSRFEPLPTYVTVTKPGSGKGGARITVKIPSGKTILANADVRTVGHFAGSASVGYAWGMGSLDAEVFYRHNLSAFARILARTPQSATINEDLYNDFFSYQGPQATLTFRQTLPGSLNGMLSLTYQRKQFGSPALNLQGAEIAGARVDRRSGAEVTLSRYFPLSSDLGLDITLNGQIVRNESNDTYNDFSGRSVGLSLGLGF